MAKTSYSELVQSERKEDSDTGGRGEYCLKRPNEFISTQGELAGAGDIPSKGMSPPKDPGIPTAVAMLSHLLPKQQAKDNSFHLPVQRPTTLPYKEQECQEVVPHEVLVENQPYRTTPLVLPHAKTIHDTGDINKKFYSASQESQGPKPYRNSSLVMPGPKTIHEAGIGAGPYRPYRGPQYFVDKKPTEKVQSVYNSPIPLYSKATLAKEVATPTISEPATQGELLLESATQQMVLESDTGARPDSQLSNTEDRWRQATDPVMGDSSINQSASFKKVMYSVMGNSDF